MRPLLFGLSLGLIFVSGIAAQWGPAIGSVVPGFALPDQSGGARTLASLTKENGAIVVFYRSADW